MSSPVCVGVQGVEDGCIHYHMHPTTETSLEIKKFHGLNLVIF